MRRRLHFECIVDEIDEHVDARRRSQDLRDFEGLDRADERDDRERQKRRHQQRRLDGAKHVPRRCAAQSRGIFETRIGIAERSEHHQIDEAGCGKRHHERDAAVRIDVDDVAVTVRERTEEHVDDAVIRVAEDRPPDRHDEARRQKRNDRNRAENAPARNVGARHEPGEKEAGTQRQRGCGERDPERRNGNRPDVRAQEHRGVIRKRPRSGSARRSIAKTARDERSGRNGNEQQRRRDHRPPEPRIALKRFHEASQTR